MSPAPGSSGPDAGAAAWVPDSRSLADLRQAVQDCRGCELWQHATQPVFSTGSARATTMLVGEQPGDQEDRRGDPFVGPAGRVLDDALLAAGITRDEVYLTNAVKHFHHTRRGKRRLHQTPELRHLVACAPWLRAELEAVDPRVVVCLGATAARAVLGRAVRIGADRGRVLTELPGRRVVVTTHPSALLRLRAHERTPGAWDDAFAALVADLAVAAG